MIYLDNASTTRVFEEAVNAMNKAYLVDYFNASATYKMGRSVAKMIEDARQVVASALSCKASEIYFTSCATESNNWVINNAFKNKKGNIVISSGEHACVYETAKALEGKGLEVRYAPMLSDGRVDIDKLLTMVDDKTNLVSVIHASNETGVINDIAQISKKIKAKYPRVLIHSDGVQAFLKTQASMASLGVDFYSLSGHKIGAPKGIGVFYVKSGVHIAPYIIGGGQEKGMRSGTENVGGIVALSAAIKAYKQAYNPEKVKENYLFALSALKSIDEVEIIGNTEKNTHLIICATALGVRAETLQSLMSDNDICIGRGSACSSKHGGNRVLSAMGVDTQRVNGAIRLSFSPFTTKDEINEAIKVLKENIIKLRGHKVG